MKKQFSLSMALIFGLSIGLSAQPGSLDNTFGDDGIVTTKILASFDMITKAVLQPDGNIVVAGYTNGAFGGGAPFLVRFQPDGALDSSFGTDGIYFLEYYTSNIISLALQPDGKLLVLGWNTVARINPDGTKDLGFGTAGVQTLNIGGPIESISAFALQADGKILLVGTKMFRLLEDGNLDPDFLVNGTSISGFTQRDVAVLSDGKIIIAGKQASDFALIQLQQNGLLDTDFGMNGVSMVDIGGYDQANSLTIQPDGKIIAVGHTTFDYNVALARFLPNGALDDSFGTNGLVLSDIGGVFSQINPIAIQADGKIVVGGQSYDVENEEFVIARFRTDGTLDSNFHIDGLLSVSIGKKATTKAVLVQPDHKIVVVGDTNYDLGILRSDEDGTLDNEFGIDGLLTMNITDVRGEITGTLLQSDGKIVTIGRLGYHIGCALARYSQDGNLDNGFGSNGFYISGLICNPGCVAGLQSDGKIVFAERSESCGQDGGNVKLTRFDTNGILDAGFEMVNVSPQEPTLLALAVQPDDKIVLLVGDGGYNMLSRFHPDGMIDSSFGSNGTWVSLLNFPLFTILSNGKILMAGNSNGDIALTRLNPDGTLDLSFGTGGMQITDFGGFENPTGLAIGPDGEIAITNGSSSDFAVACFLPDGTLDTDFGATGMATVDFGDWDSANGLVIQPDGKILVAGTVTIDSIYDFGLLRLKKDGNLDDSFGNGGLIATDIGTNDYVNSINFQADGKILVAGESDGNFAMARYISGVEINAAELIEFSNTLLHLSPNPTTDFLNLQLPETATPPTVQVFDTQGRLVLLANSQQLDVQGLALGMYSLRAIVGERVYFGKFIKQ